MTRYLKFKAPYLPSFDFRVLQMSCIWKNILKSSLPQWSIWLEMRNRMIDKDFELQTWHAIWSSRLQIFLLLTSGSSRCFVFDRILSLSSWWMWLEMGNRMIDKDFEFQTWHVMWSSRLHIFLLLTSRSSRYLLFERIFSIHHWSIWQEMGNRMIDKDFETFLSH